MKLYGYAWGNFNQEESVDDFVLFKTKKALFEYLKDFFGYNHYLDKDYEYYKNVTHETYVTIYEFEVKE